MAASPGEETELPEVGTTLSCKPTELFGEGGDPGATLEVSADPVAARIDGLARGARYRLEGEIARGGMGAILAVWDNHLRRRLAMKVALGGAASGGNGAIARFLEEAQVTGQLDHPGVVPVHELGLDEAGRVYFTMRLVRGRELRLVFRDARLGEAGWSRTRALGVLLRVCETMAFAHDKGIVHRDLKPANVMVGEYGEVYVMDWGLARVLGRADSRDPGAARDGSAGPRAALDAVATDRSDAAGSGSGSALLTRDGSVLGTPAYMPPEQAHGRLDEVGPRSDVYTLGAMLYELLAGRPPYLVSGARLSSREVLAAVRAGPPRALHEAAPDVPAELVAICDKAMARAPAERYPAMGAMAADLRAYLKGRVVAAYETGALAELRKWVLRNRGVAVATATALLLLVAGLCASWSAEQNRRTGILENGLKKIALGNSFKELGQYGNAKQRFEEAYRQLSSAGFETLTAELALADVFRSAPPPLLQVSRKRQTVWGCALLENGQRVLAVYADETVCLWDAVTGRSIAELAGHGSDEVARPKSGLPATPTAALAVNEQGGWFLLGHRDGTVTKHDMDGLRATGDVLFRHDEGPVTAIALAHDGTLAASCAADGSALVWELATGRLVRALGEGKAHVDPVVGIAFLHEDARIATAGLDRMAKVWRVDSGALEHTIEHVEEVISIAASPVADELLTGSYDRTVRRWRLANGTWQAAGELSGHTGQVWGLAYSPDGARAVSASQDRVAVLWDLADARARHSYTDHTARVASCSFSADGGLVATGDDDGVVRLWPAYRPDAIRTLLGEHDYTVFAARFSPDGRLALTASKAIQLWDVATGSLLRTYDLPAGTGPVRDAVFLPDGTGFLTAADNDAELRAWDLASGVQTGVRALAAGAERERLNAVAVSADGKRAVTGGCDGDAVVWQREPDGGWRIERRLRGHRDWVRAVSITADGTRVLTGSTIKDGTLELWSPASDTPLASLKGHGYDINGIAFLPGASHALTASGDSSVIRWDLEAGQPETRYCAHDSSVLALAVAADGSWFVSGGRDTGLILWDTERADVLRTLVDHTDSIFCIDVSRDGRLVLSGGRDRVPRLWEVGFFRRCDALRARAETARGNLAVNGDDAAALADLGAWYAFRRLWRFAAVALERAHALAPDAADPLLLGRCQWQSGNAPAARASLGDARRRSVADGLYVDTLMRALPAE